MTDTAGGLTSAPAGEVAIPASPAPNIVHLVCPCPGTPHEYDSVTLRMDGSLHMGIAFAVILQNAMGDETRVQAELQTEALRWGIEAWTFVDDRGTPVAIQTPLELSLIERWLPFPRGGMEVIEAATPLYAPMVAPFVERMSRLTQRGASAGSKVHRPSTSATNGSGPKSPKSSKRSSRPTPPAGTSSEAPAP